MEKIDVVCCSLKLFFSWPWELTASHTVSVASFPYVEKLLLRTCTMLGYIKMSIKTVPSCSLQMVYKQKNKTTCFWTSTPQHLSTDWAFNRVASRLIPPRAKYRSPLKSPLQMTLDVSLMAHLRHWHAMPDLEAAENEDSWCARVRAFPFLFPSLLSHASGF